MAIVDSLKKLLVKFGGNPSALEENATSSDVIDAISEAYTDKEGTYTEVTPIENKGTKIATITTNNTAHDIYAGKNNYYLSNSVSGTSVTLTKDTLANIASLYTSGKQILLEIFSGGIKTILSLSSQDITISPDPEDPPTYTYVFTGIFVDGDDNKIITVTFNNSTTGTMAVKTVPSGGGAELFEIQLKCHTGSPHDQITANKTAEEVLEALNAGKIPYLKIFNKDSDVQVYRSHVMLNSMSWEGSSSTPEMTFVDIENGGDGVVLIRKWNCNVWGAWHFEGWYLDSTNEGGWPM